jgi:hypothetical protein
MRLRATVLAGIALGAAGCGAPRAEQECPRDAGCGTCAAVPAVDGRAMVELHRRPVRALPPVVASVTATWTCGIEPSRLYVRRGIPPSVAVFARDEVYFSPDIPFQATQNPLHRYLYRGTRNRPERSCVARVVRGRATRAGYDGVFATGVWRVSLTASTRLRTATVDGVPRLRSGMLVKIDALDCRGRVNLIARSIAQTG